jgi:hypothetical protein
MNTAVPLSPAAAPAADLLWLVWALAPTAAGLLCVIAIHLGGRLRRSRRIATPHPDALTEAKPHSARAPAPAPRAPRDRHADRALADILRQRGLAERHRRTLASLAAVTQIHPAALLLNEPTFRRAALTSAKSASPHRPDPRAVLELGVHAFPGKHTLKQPTTQRPDRGRTPAHTHAPHPRSAR